MDKNIVESSEEKKNVNTKATPGTFGKLGMHRLSLKEMAFGAINSHRLSCRLLMNYLKCG